MDTDCFVLSVNTCIGGLKTLEDLFAFSYLCENHELLSNKNKKVNG